MVKTDDLNTDTNSLADVLQIGLSESETQLSECELGDDSSSASITQNTMAGGRDIHMHYSKRGIYFQIHIK